LADQTAWLDDLPGSSCTCSSLFHAPKCTSGLSACLCRNAIFAQSLQPADVRRWAKWKDALPTFPLVVAVLCMLAPGSSWRAGVGHEWTTDLGEPGGCRRVASSHLTVCSQHGGDPSRCRSLQTPGAALAAARVVVGAAALLAGCGQPPCLPMCSRPAGDGLDGQSFRKNNRWRQPAACVLESSSTAGVSRHLILREGSAEAQCHDMTSALLAGALGDAV
jgi:hypothetical protein